MKAKYQFFIGILVLILVLIGLTRATEALAIPLQEAGLSEEIAHLIIAAIFYLVGGLGIYWLYPVTVRAYPKSYVAIPEMKIPFTVWCILLALNPWLEFVFKRMGMENTVLAWLLVDHFDILPLLAVLPMLFGWECQKGIYSKFQAPTRRGSEIGTGKTTER